MMIADPPARRAQYTGPCTSQPQRPPVFLSPAPSPSILIPCSRVQLREVLPVKSTHASLARTIFLDLALWQCKIRKDEAQVVPNRVLSISLSPSPCRSHLEEIRGDFKASSSSISEPARQCQVRFSARAGCLDSLPVLRARCRIVRAVCLLQLKLTRNIAVAGKAKREKQARRRGPQTMWTEEMGGASPPSNHQPPAVNYIEPSAKFDFPCMVHV